MKSTLYLKGYADSEMGSLVRTLVDNGYDVLVSRHNSLKTRIDISKNEPEENEVKVKINVCVES